MAEKRYHITLKELCGQWTTLIGMFMYICSVALLCLTLCDPVDWGPPGSSMEFSGQEYWSGLSFSTPANLLNPRVEPMALGSPALAGASFTTLPSGKPPECLWVHLRCPLGMVMGGGGLCREVGFCICVQMQKPEKCGLFRLRNSEKHEITWRYCPSLFLPF